MNTPDPAAPTALPALAAPASPSRQASESSPKQLHRESDANNNTNSTPSTHTDSGPLQKSNSTPTSSHSLACIRSRNERPDVQTCACSVIDPGVNNNQYIYQLCQHFVAHQGYTLPWNIFEEVRLRVESEHPEALRYELSDQDYAQLYVQWWDENFQLDEEGCSKPTKRRCHVDVMGSGGSINQLGRLWSS